MKRFILFLAGALMAVSITACTPTQKPAETKTAAEQEHDHPEPPAGAVMEATVSLRLSMCWTLTVV